MKSHDPIPPIKPVELMDGYFDDFIGIWDDFVPKVVCDEAVKLIDDALDTDASARYLSSTDSQYSDGSQQFPDRNIGRKDFAIFLHYHEGKLRELLINIYKHVYWITLKIMEI